MARRIKLLISILLTTAIMAFAQDNDPWGGIWTSESFSEPIINSTADYKIIIRIDRKGDEYNVRGKTVKVGDPNSQTYHRPYTIKKIQGNQMWLEAYETASPSYSKGELTKYYGYTFFYKLTLNNGTIHYSHYKSYQFVYDRNMNLIEKNVYPVNGTSLRELEMFNDDW